MWSLPAIAPRPLLIANGANDPRCPVDPPPSTPIKRICEQSAAAVHAAESGKHVYVGSQPYPSPEASWADEVHLSISRADGEARSRLTAAEPSQGWLALCRQELSAHFITRS